MKKIIFILYVFWLLVWGQPKGAEVKDKVVEKESVEVETVSQEPEYTKNFREWEVTFTPSLIYKNRMPAGLEKYLSDALLNDTLIEDLLKIEAEYKILDETEKNEFLSSRDGIFMRSYEYYEGTADDIWYQVDLESLGRDDIVVWHRTEENTDILFFGWYAKALNAAKFKKDQPYFIQWEDKNYLALPYWDENEENIIGVTIHIYINGNCAVTGIGIDENSRITTHYQCYDVGSHRGPGSYNVRPEDLTLSDFYVRYVSIIDLDDPLEPPEELKRLGWELMADETINSANCDYKVYVYQYNGMEITASNLNYEEKGRDKDTFYISQIKILESGVETNRRAMIGSSRQQVEHLYGKGEESIEDDDVCWLYSYQNRGIVFKFDKDDCVKEIKLYLK